MRRTRRRLARALADGSAGALVPIETSTPFVRLDGLRAVGPKTRRDGVWIPRLGRFIAISALTVMMLRSR